MGEIINNNTRFVHQRHKFFSNAPGRAKELMYEFLIEKGYNYGSFDDKNQLPITIRHYDLPLKFDEMTDKNILSVDGMAVYNGRNEVVIYLYKIK